MNTYQRDNQRLLDLHNKAMEKRNLVLGYMVTSDDYKTETLYAIDSKNRIKVSGTVDLVMGKANSLFDVGGWKPVSHIPGGAEFIGTYKAV